jgi:signal transduction histidine kinase
MGELVSDLLLLARADSASPELHPRRVFLDDLASQVLHRLRAHPEARGRALRLGDFESAPAVVDATLVERALTVLLHNALVHASPSAIEVAAGCDEAGSWVCVRDWGPGIPEHARDEVFGRFVRLDPRVPGTGLGLPIAAWIAETHGGTLKLDAPPGGGARFILRVPAAPVGGEVSPPPPPSRRPRSASR